MVLRRLAETNPAELARLGGTGDPPLLALIAQIMGDSLLLASAEIGGPLPLPLDRTVDILIHVVAGYTLFPDGALAGADDDILRESIGALVRQLLPDRIAK